VFTSPLLELSTNTGSTNALSTNPVPSVGTAILRISSTGYGNSLCDLSQTNWYCKVQRDNEECPTPDKEKKDTGKSRAKQ
jgi:hypothetical protein